MATAATCVMVVMLTFLQLEYELDLTEQGRDNRHRGGGGGGGGYYDNYHGNQGGSYHYQDRCVEPFTAVMHMS